MLTARKPWLLGMLLGAAFILLLLLAAGLVVVYTGAYSVAATEKHTPLVRWAFTTTLNNAVRTRAEGIEPPEDFSSTQIMAGAIQYKAMCEHCHGGPGAPRASWVEGMLPMPPQLSDAAQQWNTRELFWLVKHGIKMSGMPAFGEHHDDQALWTIAAFVEQLPDMTQDEYAQAGAPPEN